MKRLLIVLLLVFTTSLVSADTIEEIKEGGEIIGYRVIIIISPAEYKALEWGLMDTLKWCVDAIRNKARRNKDRIVLLVSDKNPAKIDDAEKDQIVKDANVKTRKEREKEAQDKLDEKFK